MVGATIAAFFVGIVMLFVNFPVGLIVWIVYAILYQQIENYVIQPQIQRRAVQVEPLVILVAVLFGSTLFGVPGALLAIPTAASLQIVVRELLDYRRAPPPSSGRSPGRASAATSAEHPPLMACAPARTPDPSGAGAWSPSAGVPALVPAGPDQSSK